MNKLKLMLYVIMPGLVFSFFVFLLFDARFVRFMDEESKFINSNNQSVEAYFNNFIYSLKTIHLEAHSEASMMKWPVNWVGQININRQNYISIGTLFGKDIQLDKNSRNWVYKVLNTAKKNTEKIFFYSGTDPSGSSPFLYFLHADDTIPFQTYLGRIDLDALAEKIRQFNRVHSNGEEHLYLVHQANILSPQVSVNDPVKNIVSLIKQGNVGEGGSHSEDNYGTYNQDGLRMIYMPVFLKGHALWVLKVRNSSGNGQLMSIPSSHLIGFVLTIISAIAIYLLAYPIIQLNKITKNINTDNPKSLFRLCHQMKSIKGKKSFVELDEILGAVEKITYELASYQENTEYKLDVYRGVMYQEYKRRLHFERQQRKKALYDELTGLPNKYLLDERLRMMFKYTVDNSKVGIILVNISSIIETSKEYSFIVSDSMLKGLSTSLKNRVGEAGELYRYSFYQFVFVLDYEKCKNDIRKIIKDIFLIVNSPDSYVENKTSDTPESFFSRGCSIGLAVTETAITAKSLIAMATENSKSYKGFIRDQGAAKFNMLDNIAFEKEK